MRTLVIWTVIDIVALIAGLAIYLLIVGIQLRKVAANLEEAADLVWKIKGNAEVIEPALKRINRTGGVVAGALPLLYGMAEGIVVGATYKPDHSKPEPARPAMGVRRSRQFEGIGLKAD
jgi:predicted GNAT superfamily acetyltransferase